VDVGVLTGVADKGTARGIGVLRWWRARMRRGMGGRPGFGTNTVLLTLLEGGRTFAGRSFRVAAFK